MKIWFHTFGCRVNQYETQVLREKLLSDGISTATGDFQAADVCVVNTCTVTSEADREALALVRRIARRNPAARLVVTGCLASRDPEAVSAAAPAATVVGNEGKANLPARLGCRTGDGLAQISSFNGHSRAFLKVQDGCNMHCAFCIIPSVRPRLWSKPIDELVVEARGLIERGYPELVLCGIRLGRYSDTDSAGRRVDFPALLERLLELPGDFRIRLSSLEITDLTDRLIGLLEAARGKICPSLHLPLQSGSEGVLRRMGRWYSAAFYERRIQALRGRLADAALFTDVMVGFPGETDAEFFEGEGFLRRVGFAGLHVFRYSRRPGTPAARAAGAVPELTLRGRADTLRGLDRALRRSFALSSVGSRRRVVAALGRSVGLSDDFLEINLKNRLPGAGFHWVRVTGAADDGSATAQGVLDPEPS